MPTEEESNTVNFNQRRRRTDNETSTNQKLNIFTYIFGLQNSRSAAKMKKGDFWSQRQQFKDTSISIRKYPCLKKCKSYTKWNIHFPLWNCLMEKISLNWKTRKRRNWRLLVQTCSSCGKSTSPIWSCSLFYVSLIYCNIFMLKSFLRKKYCQKVHWNPQLKKLDLCPLYTLRQIYHDVNHWMVILLL